jgi:hypothetical protein
VLTWIQKKGIRNFKEMAPMLDFYVTRPQETYQRALAETRAMGLQVKEVEELRR